MLRAQLTKVLLLGVLLLGGSQAHPLRGRKRAFGMGLLGGALAGAAIGHAVAKAPGSSKAAAPAAAPVAQVVENGVPDANGCYKQTIREPVTGHPGHYIETVHLVCPQRPAAAAPQPAMPAPVHVLPVAQAPAASVYPVIPAPAPVATHVVAAAVPVANATHLNGTLTVTTLGHPNPVPVPVPAVPAPAAAPAPAPSAAAATSPHSSLTFAYATAPIAQPAQPVQQAPAQVFLLSKTVKKQKSAASSVNVSYGLLMLVVLYCLISR
ncbi:PREDICTED: translation initiation factor IF-2 [Drosophila arizonae]|uniref:Translation initiation factor IF-2 n=1 Tax=Drosophila arizonae TaxID=7263 RepID=A0ABM1NMI3_DROAR|nr:PREDICTED: translation initiation factor IF-2 [Drosophila arizonae]